MASNPATTTAAPFVPAGGPKTVTIATMRRAAAGCRGCDLYRKATQVVFGEGPAPADLFLVGEQPGDREDRTGRVFVGPAGRVLDEALEAAGIARDRVYVTNAVKHFRWSESPTRRLHKRPGAEHVRACRPWFEAEIARVRPKVLVCLGAVAAQSAFGKAVAIRTLRGRVHATDLCERTWVTVHPSSILRQPDARSRREAMAGFVRDLRGAVELVASAGLRRAG